MDAEIRPEPTPDERRAIQAALDLALVPEPDLRGAWWRAGIREALGSSSPRPGAGLEQPR